MRAAYVSLVTFLPGNNLISALSSQKRYTLRIDLADFNGEWRLAQYDNFMMDGAQNKYTLTLGNYSGDAGRFVALI